MVALDRLAEIWVAFRVASTHIIENYSMFSMAKRVYLNSIGTHISSRCDPLALTCNRRLALVVVVIDLLAANRPSVFPVGGL